MKIECKNYKEIVEVFKKIVNELGRIPNTRDLIDKGVASVLNLVVNYGGIQRVYKELGIVSRVPKGYWDNIENVHSEIKYIIEVTGRFPSYPELRKMVVGLDDAIKKHGGMKEFRAIYKVPISLPKLLKINKWVDFNDIVTLYQELINDLGRFPNKEDLVQRGISGVMKAINHHGGFYKLYEALGIKSSVKPKGYWNDIKNIYMEIERIIKKTGVFPSLNYLSKLGLSSMATAIVKKHGGMNKIREVYNSPLESVPYRYYSDFTIIFKIIMKCEKELGHFPSIGELDNFNPGIKKGILKYHGNYTEIRKKLNVKLVSNKPYYWKEFKVVKNAIEQLIEQLGYFPSYEEIEKYGPSGLYQGIAKYHDGLTGVREKLGLKPKSKSILEKRVKIFLDSYIEENCYIDNRKKMLFNKYGVELRHPDTNNFLEIDRYYPKQRVAIDIQGEQHSKEIPFFAENKNKTASEYLQDIIRVDASKNVQCKEQGIKFIEIHYYDSKEEILNKIKNALPIREHPKQPNKLDVKPYNQEDQVINALIEIQLNKDGVVTSKDVQTYSRPIYEEMNRLYGGIHKAREAAGIQQNFKS